MTLSCACNEWGSGYSYEPPSDFEVFSCNKRKRCRSCSKLIDKGSTALMFREFKYTESDIEEAIYGSEKELAPKWLCGSCGEIHLNLSDIGYCFSLGDNMQDALAEYHQLTGFKKHNKKEV